MRERKTRERGARGSEKPNERKKKNEGERRRTRRERRGLRS
jgi:hypothetical protein